LEWLHRSNPIKADCRLRMRAGRSSAGLSGISVECSCGQRRSFGDVFRFDENKGGPLAKLGLDCSGLRPWLGDMDSGPGGCGHFLRVLQRGATNVYFPHVVSSIYLPLWAEQISSDVIAVLEQPHVWALLSQGTVNGRVDPMRCQVVAGMTGVDAKALESAAQRKLEGSLAASAPAAVIDEEEFRRALGRLDETVRRVLEESGMSEEELAGAFDLSERDIVSRRHPGS